MKRAAYLTLVILITLYLTTPLLAVPSFRGYTGLVIIPTADTLNRGEFNVGVMTEDVSDFDANDIFFNYGIIDNLEFGFNSFLPIDEDDRGTLINAKYSFMRETDTLPGVAVGIVDLTDDEETTVYAVASKSIGRCLNVFDGEITNLRAHVGIGGGRLSGPFIGFSAFVGNRAMFSFEWDSEDVNIGFRFTPIRQIRLHAALFDLGGDKNDIGVGASYNFFY